MVEDNKMMVTIPEIMGVIIGIICMYYAYIQFKKKIFELTDLILWIAIWGGLILLSAVSGFVSLSKVIFLYRIIDLVFVFSTLLLFALIFFLYTKLKSYQRKTGDIVQKIALMDAEKSRKGGK